MLVQAQDLKVGDEIGARKGTKVAMIFPRNGRLLVKTTHKGIRGSAVQTFLPSDAVQVR